MLDALVITVAAHQVVHLLEDFDHIDVVDVVVRQVEAADGGTLD